MMSMQSSTHSSQMNTVGPAMSLRTSCCDLPQNEQYRVFFESPDLLMRTPPPGNRGTMGNHNSLQAVGTRTAENQSLKSFGMIRWTEGRRPESSAAQWV